MHQFRSICVTVQRELQKKSVLKIIYRKKENFIIKQMNKKRLDAALFSRRWYEYYGAWVQVHFKRTWSVNNVSKAIDNRNSRLFTCKIQKIKNLMVNVLRFHWIGALSRKVAVLNESALRIFDMLRLRSVKWYPHRRSTRSSFFTNVHPLSETRLANTQVRL